MTSTTMRASHTIMSVVDGGKRIVILEDSFDLLSIQVILKEKTKLITISLADSKKYLNKSAEVYHSSRSDGLFLLVDTILTYDSDTINYIIVTKIT